MTRARPGMPGLSMALVALLAGLPFLPSLTASYLADDWFFVAAYRATEEPFSSLVWRALTSLSATPTTFYRPLPFMSLAAQLRLGHDAFGLHAVNLFLHVVAALLVCAMARRLTGRTSVAIAAALFFAWFPRRTEAVAWLSCRPDLLATVCALGTIVAFQRFADGRRVVWCVTAVVLWWLAVLSKESALLVGLACVALTGIPTTAGTAAFLTRRPLARLWVLPFLLSVPAFVVVRRLIVGAWVGGYGAEAVVPGPATLVSAVKHLAYQVVPPLELLETAVRTGSGTTLTGLVMAAIAVGIALAAWWARDQPATRVGALWAVFAIAPVMVLPVSLTTTFNDRLLYLPGVGIALIAAGVLARMRGRAAAATLVGLSVLCGAMSFTLSARWRQAGALSDGMLGRIAGALADEPASRIYLTAVPDSIGGAYLLRNGVREALAMHGAVRPERVAVLAWYFLPPDAPARRVVRATRISPDAVSLESVTTSPQIIVGTPDARELIEYDAPASTDRLGRRDHARLRARQPGVFWFVGPAGVEVVAGASR